MDKLRRISFGFVLYEPGEAEVVHLHFLNRSNNLLLNKRLVYEKALI